MKRNIHALFMHVPLTDLSYYPMYCVYDVINIRLTKTGSLGLSKPCVFCRDMLNFFNVKNIWFSCCHCFVRL